MCEIENQNSGDLSLLRLVIWLLFVVAMVGEVVTCGTAGAGMATIYYITI